MIEKSLKVKTINSIVNGKRWLAKSDHSVVTFANQTSVKIDIGDIEFINELNRTNINSDQNLQNIPLDEIVAFLYNCGQNWKKRDYVRRSLYERSLINYLGYSERAAQNEADWIAMILSSGFRFYDILQAELGDWSIVDKWSRREEALIRALPRGQVLHIVPGNVPLSTLVSLLRAIITKNRSVVKMASTDPFTAVAIANSFADVDPHHPVTTSLSVTYWPGAGDSVIGAKFAAASDCIIAWGGAETVEWAYKFANPATEVIAFGPKRSFSCVGEHAHLARAAETVATDVCLYDQRGCFSTREVFVHNSVYSEFADRLDDALNRLGDILPLGGEGYDQIAVRTLTSLHADFYGGQIGSQATKKWLIVDGRTAPAGQHPLGRTVYLFGYDDLNIIYDAIDSNTQTIAVSPWQLSEQIRDECAKRGVSRIVESGMSNVFRVGGSHDSVFPLQRLVKYISNELPSAQRVKGIHVPINQFEFLEHDRFLEFIP